MLLDIRYCPEMRERNVQNLLADACTYIYACYAINFMPKNLS